MEASNNGDSLLGYDEPYVVFSSNLSTQPGIWQLATSPVPEPQACLMFLAGLGVIGSLSIVRRSNTI